MKKIISVLLTLMLATSVYAADPKANRVRITDDGDYYTGTEVESALQEVGDGTTLDNRYLKLTNAGDVVVVLNDDRASSLWWQCTGKNLAVWNTANGAEYFEYQDDVKTQWGTGGDLKVYHNGTNTYIDNATGDLKINPTASSNVSLFDGDGSVADDANGKIFAVNRRSVGDEDNTFQIYIDSNRNAQFQADASIYFHTVSGDLRLYADNGELRLQPFADNDVVCFSESSVGDDESGKTFSVCRNADEGDRQIDISIDSYQEGVISLPANSNIRGDDLRLNDTGANVWLGDDSMTSGKNPALRHYGYLTSVAASKYVSWQLDDSDDYFHLAKEDANILGFKVDMDLIASGNITGANLNISNWDTAYGWGNHASANYAVKTASNTHTAGTKNTFQSSATTAGLNLGGLAGNPSGAAKGDVWYNTSTDRLMYYGAASREVVARTLAQTLTTKTIALGSNTVSGTKAQFDTACTDGNFAYSGGAFHDGFSDFVAAEHYDWTNETHNFLTTGSVTANALTVGEDDLLTMGSGTLKYDSTGLAGNNPGFVINSPVLGTTDFVVAALPGTSYPSYTTGFRVDYDAQRPGVYFKRSGISTGYVTCSQNASGSFTDFHTFGILNNSVVGDVTHTNGIYSMNWDASNCQFTLVEGADTITLRPSTSQTYAASNVTTDRTYDANATTTDELADVLGTLIADLRTKGLVK